MIKSIITLSLRWPTLVLISFGLLLALGYRATISTPVDAIPDLSDVQVIVKVVFIGQLEIVSNAIQVFC